MQFSLLTVIIGFVMGIAEVIPGVSGGTIAFISGIYEKLIDSIKAFDVKLLKLVSQMQWKKAWEKINGAFLLNLGVGMVCGIVIGIFTITYLLENYPEPLWGFFFGLVLASAIILGKHMTPFSISKVFSIILGAGIAIWIALVTPTQGSDNFLYIFICGMIAISAFILPGVSGSFMLLLLGTYTIIIPSLKNVISNFDGHSLSIIIVFAMGCIVGITGFSRILSWLFHHYKAQTFAMLTGFLIGSLLKIWPWRNTTLIIDKLTGNTINISDGASWAQVSKDGIKTLKEMQVLPSDYWMGDPKTAITIICIIIGFIAVYSIERFNKPTDHISD